MSRMFKRTHVLGDVLQNPSGVLESKRKRNPNEEKAKMPAPVSSVGEERALFLGFVMMAFSILMYFLVGIVVVKPCFNSEWNESAECSLVHFEFLNETDDCKAVTSFSCLQVIANITASGKRVRLHTDEAVIHLSPEPTMSKEVFRDTFRNKFYYQCLYIPNKHHNKSTMVKEAQNIKRYLSEEKQSFTCYLSPLNHPDDAIVKRRHDLKQALQCLVWPSLMLFGGVLLIGLVKLTQCLAHLSTEMSLGQEVEDDRQILASHENLYEMIECRPCTFNVEEVDEEESTS